MRLRRKPSADSRELIAVNMEKFKIQFLPDNKVIEVEKGATILSAAISAGIHINSSCGGDGVCGRCKVIVKKGQVASLPTGRITLEERKQGYHLSCLSVAQSDVEVEIPKIGRASCRER